MKKLIAASIISALIAAPAVAAVPGAYIGVDLQSWTATNTGILGNPGMGLRIGGGYRFTPNVGVEVGIAQSGASTDFFGFNYKASATQVAAVGTLPINPQFDVFGKLGMSANKLTFSVGTCTTCSKTSVMFGLGAQYNISPQLGVRAQYESLGDATSAPVGPQVKLTTMSVGVAYAF